MSIRSQVMELERVQYEIKRLYASIKNWRVKEAEIKANKAKYLEVKEQPGVKWRAASGVQKALVAEQKEVPTRKKPKEQIADAIAVLENYHVENPEKVLEEILAARQGEKIVKKKLKLVKLRKKKNEN